MKIAINIMNRRLFEWSVAAGALEFARRNHTDGIEILLPATSSAEDFERDSTAWDAAIVHHPDPNLKIPQVSVSSSAPGNIICVTTDEAKVAELVVDQFISMGLRNLAFAGFNGWKITEVRWLWFSKILQSHGITPSYIEINDKLLTKLTMLPKPCGMMVVDEDWGNKVLDDCKRKSNLRIPGEVNVIAVGNSPDPVQPKPTLSCVDIPFHHIGYHAARLCARMVAGESVESIKIAPSGIILRESVSTPGSEMNNAAAVAHFLRMNLDQTIEMEDIVRQSNLSRRRLEQVFREVYNTSPMAYLRAQRLELAKHLLRHGSAPLKEVAKAAGYSDVHRLCRTFRWQLQITPLAYRNEHRQA